MDGRFERNLPAIYSLLRAGKDEELYREMKQAGRPPSKPRAIHVATA